MTTRPIGYSTTEIHHWRHYEIAPLAEPDTAEHLETLCRWALDEDSVERTDDLLPRIRAYLKEGSASRMLARSPLLLAFGTSLFLNWKDPSKTKLELYQRIFRLIDPAPRGRRDRTRTSSPRDPQQRPQSIGLADHRIAPSGRGRARETVRADDEAGPRRDLPKGAG